MAVEEEETEVGLFGVIGKWEDVGGRVAECELSCCPTDVVDGAGMAVRACISVPPPARMVSLEVLAALVLLAALGIGGVSGRAAADEEDSALAACGNAVNKNGAWATVRCGAKFNAT